MVPRDFRSEVQDLLEEFLFLYDPFDEREDLVGVERLGDVIGGAQLDGLNGGLERLDGGDDHHLGLLVQLLDAAQDLQTVHPRHADVQEDQIDVARAEHAKGLGTLGGEQKLVVLREDRVK